jgi:uncharacterized tellurite resistance protein B-like protein
MEHYSVLDKLRALFSSEEAAEAPAIETDLAAASLMLEVSWSDHHVGEAELLTMRRLLADLYALSPEKIDALIDDAQARLSENVGLHPYTSFLNEHLDEEARFQVICALWQLALADDRIDKFEEHTIRRASDLLYLSHSRFIEAKLQAKAKRS